MVSKSKVVVKAKKITAPKTTKKITTKPNTKKVTKKTTTKPKKITKKITKKTTTKPKTKKITKQITPKKEYSKTNTPVKGSLPGYKMLESTRTRRAVLRSIIDDQGIDHVFSSLRRLYPFHHQRESFQDDFAYIKKLLPIKRCPTDRVFSRLSNKCIKA